MSKQKILMVLTSHDALGDTGQKTGYWLEEFAAPYYVLKDAGLDITLASIKGGKPPVDPKSEGEDWQTDDTRRLEKDAEVQAELGATVKVAEVDVSSFDGIFFPGGHGPMWDFVGTDALTSVIEVFDRAGKPIGAVCHGVAALVDPKAADGKPLVSGKKVSGFSNNEEAAVQLTEVVPFLIEDKFTELGGTFVKGDDFTPFSVVDGNLATGQNPQSSVVTAKAFLELLN